MILGFDFGTKKIGIAAGQQLTRTASPVGTVRVHDGLPMWPELDAIIQTWQPKAFVVGCALNDDQSVSKTAEKAQAFGFQISERYKIPVYFENEHLTSFEARQLNKSRSSKKAHNIDALAAMLILETWLKGA